MATTQTRHSYGLVTVINVDGVQHVVMIKQRSSYNFIYIMFKKWKTKEELKELLRETTDHEREQILNNSVTFTKIWEDLWIDMNSRIARHNRMKGEVDFKEYRELYQTILRENNFPSWDIPLSFPKGRMDNRVDAKNPLNTAIREFNEETRLELHPRIDETMKCTETSSWGLTTWVCTYYLAKVNMSKLPSVSVQNFSMGTRRPHVRNAVSTEVESVHFLTLEDAIAQATPERADILRKLVGSC